MARNRILKRKSTSHRMRKHITNIERLSCTTVQFPTESVDVFEKINSVCDPFYEDMSESTINRSTAIILTEGANISAALCQSDTIEHIAQITNPHAKKVELPKTTSSRRIYFH